GGGLFIFGGHPEALQGVGLGARAVLPGDVDLQVAERVVGLEVERLVAQALVPPGVANQDVGAEALGAVAVLAVVLDLRGGALRASDAPRPRRPTRALSRSASLSPGGLVSLAPGGPSRAVAFLPARHPVASPTWTVPRSGSSTILRRCSRRSRRPAMITSAPLVLPFGKKRICTTPSLKAWPPRTSSMTARSVSTAQRPQPVVWMLFSRASRTSSCGWPRATASPRQ